MSPLFADFADTLGWVCFGFLGLIGLALWAVGHAASALFQSDAAKDVATEVATEVIEDAVTSWLKDRFG